MPEPTAVSTVTDTPANNNAVIIGAGQAGAQTAFSLRQQGFKGRVVLVGDEPTLPYQRPPLSKAYLAGELPEARLYIKPQGFYDKADIELLTGSRVEGIDPSARQVRLADGDTLAYRHLVLATGGRARRLNCPGAEDPRVHYLRTLEDVRGLQANFVAGKRLVVIGGGYVGLETAAVAARHGLQVTVLVARPTVLNRVCGPDVSRFFTQVHRDAGVALRCDTAVTAIRAESQYLVIDTNNGYSVQADLLVAGIGLEPNTELAEAAGIACDNGIATDENGRCSLPDIYAAGDCASHPSAIYARRLRLESVQNAVEQAKTVAASICGKHRPYTQAPWFWSDQFDLKLQSAGVVSGFDQSVVRGDSETRSFAVFYYRAGVLIAVDAINRPAEFVAARKLLDQGLSPSPEVVCNEAIPPADFAAAVTGAKPVASHG